MMQFNAYYNATLQRSGAEALTARRPGGRRFTSTASVTGLSSDDTRLYFIAHYCTAVEQSMHLSAARRAASALNSSCCKVYVLYYVVLLCCPNLQYSTGEQKHTLLSGEAGGIRPEQLLLQPLHHAHELVHHVLLTCRSAKHELILAVAVRKMAISIQS